MSLFSALQENIHGLWICPEYTRAKQQLQEQSKIDPTELETYKRIKGVLECASIPLSTSDEPRCSYLNQTKIPFTNISKQITLEQYRDTTEGIQKFLITTLKLEGSINHLMRRSSLYSLNSAMSKIQGCYLKHASLLDLQYVCHRPSLALDLLFLDDKAVCKIDLSMVKKWNQKMIDLFRVRLNTLREISKENPEWSMSEEVIQGSLGHLLIARGEELDWLSKYAAEILQLLSREQLESWPFRSMNEAQIEFCCDQVKRNIAEWIELCKIGDNLFYLVERCSHLYFRELSESLQEKIELDSLSKSKFKQLLPNTEIDSGFGSRLLSRYGIETIHRNLIKFEGYHISWLKDEQLRLLETQRLSKLQVEEMLPIPDREKDIDLRYKRWQANQRIFKSFSEEQIFAMARYLRPSDLAIIRQEKGEALQQRLSAFQSRTDHESSREGTSRELSSSYEKRVQTFHGLIDHYYIPKNSLHNSSQ